MTILNPEGYLPGLGDCGRNWLDNHPTYKVEKILEMTNAHCFAAHPFQLMGILEKFIFRRGYWKHEDFAFTSKHPIRGIQFWNGPRDDGFDLGREFWINELGQGNFLLPIGGNDAHGDLNDTTAVDLPLFSLKHTRDHVFGRVRTVVQISENKNFEEIDDPLAALHQAFAGDNCYITNGPALWWERHTDLSGRECITFFAKNTKDYGEGFKYIRIYGRKKLLNGKWSKNEEICMQSQVAAKAETKIKMDFEDYAYLRAECETATGHYALTSAAATLLR